MTSFYRGFRKDLMKINYQTVNNLKVSDVLLKFVNDELLKDTSISPDKFWSGFDKCVHELTPRNKELLSIRDKLQKKIDDWHVANKGKKSILKNIKNF